jgi:hypothetical protein
MIWGESGGHRMGICKIYDGLHYAFKCLVQYMERKVKEKLFRLYFNIPAIIGEKLIENNWFLGESIHFFPFAKIGYFRLIL